MNAERKIRSADLLRFASDVELAGATADAWLDELATHNQKQYSVALSGGRISLKLFSAIVERAQARNISLANVDFFWADERCVPPHDPESNFAAAEKLLFKPLQITSEKIHRIHGEEPPEFAAQQAEAEICRVAPLNDDGQPILDLIFLGMGEDGHTASLFPGEPESLRDDKAVYRPVFNSPKPPPNRVTLGYAAIAAARQIWVLVSGAGKENAFRESLQRDGKTPLARVLKSRPDAKIFTDLNLQ